MHKKTRKQEIHRSNPARSVLVKVRIARGWAHQGKRERQFVPVVKSKRVENQIACWYWKVKGEGDVNFFLWIYLMFDVWRDAWAWCVMRNVRSVERWTAKKETERKLSYVISSSDYVLTSYGRLNGECWLVRVCVFFWCGSNSRSKLVLFHNWAATVTFDGKQSSMADASLVIWCWGIPGKPIFIFVSFSDPGEYIFL